jgi:hypothetical protein
VGVQVCAYWLVEGEQAQRLVAFEVLARVVARGGQVR